jgi:AcrR family transcriptional regulator
MARANTQRQADRRTEILTAAMSCFARSGFHQTSINDICTAAGMSPGNLYRYFPSKEAIIAAIVERNGVEAAESFASVSRADNFSDAFAGLAHFHLVERSQDQINLCAEIMAESRRNPDIARVNTRIEGEVKSGLAAMLRNAAQRGEISSDVEFDDIATILMVLGDGIFWRRAVDPSFDPEATLPLVLRMVNSLIRFSSGRAAEDGS